MRAHISINVSNVGKSVEFYKKVFAIVPQKQTQDYAKFDLLEPSLNFSMLTASEDRNLSRMNHLGIEVKTLEEVKEWRSKLDTAGIKTISEEDTNCCFAIQDKIWFQDPDGNSWEVFFVKEQVPLEPQKPKMACDSASGCC